MLKITETYSIKRKERRLLKKLSSASFYQSIKHILNTFLSPVKIFFTISGHGIKKVWGVISVSNYKIFGKKIAYIDDFIVNNKSRGKWFWKQLIDTALKKSKQGKSDYITLVSQSHRKVSHQLYKKIWFSIVSFWVFIIAYKSLKNKK